jgi:uncharacterized protein (DUF58 family)
VREYTPGDSRRWIHWRTSARHDALYVRLFEGVPAGDWWILLDLNREVQAGEGTQATEEHGVILAASLADRGLRAGKAVGLVAHGEDLVWLRPRGGEGRRWEILRALALVSVGEHSLTQLLAQIGPALGRYASLIVITPAVDGEWVESLVPLMRRDIVPTVLLLDRASFDRAQHRSFDRARGMSFDRAQEGSFSGQSDVRRTGALLAELGVVSHVISRDLLDPSEMQPGRRGHWEWRVLGTGHAVPVRKPQDMAWRTLT